MSPRGNQPQERVCEANWRRSLCAAKRDPRLRGCTPLRTPKRKSEGAGAKRKQYYFSFLTPPPLPPLLSRCSPEPPLPETAVRRGRACPARSLAIAAPFIFCIVGRGLDPSAGRRGRRPLHHLPQTFRHPPVNGKGGGLPPSLAPLGHNDSRHPVGAGHARPAALRQLPVSFCIPFIFYIVGRGCGVANRGHG